MAYRQCSRCGLITDEDELKCPYCEESPPDGKIITSEELISRIKKKEIAPSKIWIKNLNKFSQALESLPR